MLCYVQGNDDSKSYWITLQEDVPAVVHDLRFRRGCWSKKTADASTEVKSIESLTQNKFHFLEWLHRRPDHSPNDLMRNSYKYWWSLMIIPANCFPNLISSYKKHLMEIKEVWLLLFSLHCWAIVNASNKTKLCVISLDRLCDFNYNLAEG